MRLFSLLAAACLVAAPLSAQTVDPAGQYTWSFDMQDGTSVRGTLAIVHTDSGYRATSTSDHSDGELPADAVTVNGNHVTVTTSGDFGTFTLDMQLDKEPIAATYKLDMDSGTSTGPIAVERAKPASPTPPIT